MSLARFIYASFNEAIEEACAAGASGVPIRFGRPTADNPIPANCFWVYWLEHASPPGNLAANSPAGLIQIAVRVPDEDVATALDRTNGLDDAMGLTAGAGYGRLEVKNYDLAGSPIIAHADVRSQEMGWIPTPEPSDPSLIQLIRTVELSWAVD